MGVCRISGNMNEMIPANKNEREESAGGTNDSGLGRSALRLPPLKPAAPEAGDLDADLLPLWKSSGEDAAEASVANPEDNDDESGLLIDSVAEQAHNSIRSTQDALVDDGDAVDQETDANAGDAGVASDDVVADGDGDGDDDGRDGHPDADGAPGADDGPAVDSRDGESTPTEVVYMSKRARIMRYAVAPVAAVLAVVLFVFGVANMTWWKPDPAVSVDTGELSTRYLTTDAGVLALADGRVHVKVKGKADKQVCVAVAEPRDVTGWLSGERYVRVTGLESWERFSTQKADPTGDLADPNGQVAFRDSDMWRQVACGDGGASLDWNADHGNSVLLVDADAGAAPTDPNDAGARTDATASLTLSWTRAAVTDFSVPCFVAGAVLLAFAILSATLFAMKTRRRRGRGGHGARRERKRNLNGVEAESGMMSDIDADDASDEMQPAPVVADGSDSAADESADRDRPSWLRPGGQPPAPRENGRRTRRHARHSSVAEVQGDASDIDELDATSVDLFHQKSSAVSVSDLQEYFARLAEERQADDRGDADAADDTKEDER